MVLATGILLWLLEGIAPFFVAGMPRNSHARINISLAVCSLFFILPADVATMVALDAAGPHFTGLAGLLPHGAPRSVFVLLLLDFWMYVWHRINHNVPFFWRFHSIHHNDGQLDVTSSWRFHPGEILFSGLLRLPFLILIGAGADDLLLYTLLMTPVIQFHHSNIRIDAMQDRLLRLIIPTPLLHRIHHSTVRSEHDSNYGAMLSLWDRLFGTLTVKSVSSSTPVGLEGQGDAESQRLLSLLKRPFSGTLT
jgi:sterol desaturase/sphingolipid hydroxylase (fatty acid hydroxylase superfamily)